MAAKFRYLSCFLFVLCFSSSFAQYQEVYGYYYEDSYRDYSYGYYHEYDSGCGYDRYGYGDCSNHDDFINQAPCSNGAVNYPYCTRCAAGQQMYNGVCAAEQRCDPLPLNAYWVGGHGNYYPYCEFRCQSGYDKVGNTCIAHGCNNGATDFPYCTSCPAEKVLINGQCLSQTCPSKPSHSSWQGGSCQWTCDSGYYQSGYACLPNRVIDTAATIDPVVYPTYTSTTPQPTSGYTQTFDGVCGNALNTCQVGEFTDLTDRTTRARWRCEGSGFGISVDCSLPISTGATGSSCGSAVNTCSSGTFFDLSDTSSSQRWRCVASDGSATDCSNTGSGSSGGLCGSAINTCTSGTFQDLSDTSSNYKWRCSGNGGAQDCYSKKAQYSWKTTDWSKCSKTCGKSRNVYCMRDDGVKVADSFCSASKPKTTMSCNQPKVCGSRKSNSGGFLCDGNCTPDCNSDAQLSSNKKSCDLKAKSYSSRSYYGGGYGYSYYYGGYYGSSYYSGSCSTCRTTGYTYY